MGNQTEAVWFQGEKKEGKKKKTFFDKNYLGFLEIL